MIKLQAGQKVCVRYANPRRWGEFKEGYTVLPVEKVGRKYFYVDGVKYDLATLRKTNSYPNNKVYLGPQDIADEIMALKLHKHIAKYFDSNWKPSLKLGTLKKIKGLIDDARF